MVEEGTQIKEVSIFYCEVCYTGYDTEEEAKACEELPVDPYKFDIGDEVKATFNSSVADIFPDSRVLEKDDEKVVIRGEVRRRDRLRFPPDGHVNEYFIDPQDAEVSEENLESY